MMAEAAEMNGKKHTTDLRTLKEQIVCRVCKKQYHSPKTLPCLHSFCASCLQSISTHNSAGTKIQCPECKKEVSVEGGDCDENFPDAFHINHQIQLYTFLQKVNGKVEVKCEKCSSKSVRATSFCGECGKFICELCVTIHRSWSEFSSHQVLSLKALKESYHKHLPDEHKSTTCPDHTKECHVYCETCEELICHECIMKAHREHHYNLASDAASKHKMTMKVKLDDIKGIPGQLQGAINTVGGISQKFSAKGQAVTDEINAEFDKLQQSMTTHRNALIQDITRMVESKLRLLQDQRESLELMKVKVSTCLDFVTQTTASDHVSEFFMLHRQMTTRVAEVKGEFSNTDLTPVEEPEAHFSLNLELLNRLPRAGSVSDGSILYAGLDDSHFFTVSEIVTFYIALSSAYCKSKTNPVEELKAEIQSLRDESICPASIAVSSSGFAKLQCSFSERGRYSVTVIVGDHHISGSPYVFFVKPPSTQFTSPVKTIPKLGSPKGLAVNSKNEIILSEESRHAVSVFGKKSKKMLSIGSFGSDKGQFNHPVGVAVDSSGCIYVADSKNNRIQKFDPDGNLLATFNGEKSPSGLLNSPMGVKLNSEEKLFIVDRGNHRIVVLNLDLEFELSFGAGGDGLGHLEDPWDIAFDKDGFYYITDTKQHCIQIFNKGGEFRGKIGAHGTQKGKLNRPSGIAIDQFSRVFVCEFGNHRVSIFHTCSEFLGCFSTGLSMVNPCGVAVDGDGYVYISSAETVHVF